MSTHTFSKTIAAFLFAGLLNAHADVRPGFQFTLGMTSMPLNNVTTSNTGKRDFMGELYNPLGFRYSFSVGPSYQWSMILNTSRLSLISNKDKDKGLDSYMTTLGTEMFFTTTSNLAFKTQLGIMVYDMKGKGGTTELNNGNSTMEFILPSKERSSKVSYFGGGMLYDFDVFNIDTSFNITSPISSTRRNYFLALSIGIPL